MSEAEMTFKYFYGKESDAFTFYRIPKLLITDDYFNGLPGDAKILYGLMLDRMSLSAKNGWLDEQKRVFIYFSMEDTMTFLNCGKNKALTLLSALDTGSGIGLIERVKQGQGKPMKIYVKSFMRQSDEQIQVPEQRFENQTSEDEEAVSKVYKSNVLRFENQTSGLPKSKPLEVSKSNPNNNKKNDIEINSNESILISSAIENDTKREKLLSDMKKYEELVKSNIEYQFLIERYPLDHDLIDELVDLVVEILVSQSSEIVISSNRYPIDLVRSRFLKLDFGHMEYVLSCMKENTTKVRNIKKYMLTCLFNAPVTIGNYYAAEVNHDMANYSG